VKYTLKCARHHQSYEEQHDTLEEAIEAAFSNHDSGEARSKCIVDEEGKVVRDHDGLILEYAIKEIKNGTITNKS